MACCGHRLGAYPPHVLFIGFSERSMMKKKILNQNLASKKTAKRKQKRKDFLKAERLKNRTPKDLREHKSKGDDVLNDIIADIVRAL